MSCLSYTHVPYIPARVCSGPSNIRVTVNDISEVLDLTSRRPTSTRVYLTGTCTHKLNAHKLNTPSNFVCIVAVCLSVKGFFEDLTTHVDLLRLLDTFSFLVGQLLLSVWFGCDR